MNNEEWKKVWAEGFAAGYNAAKKEMNYQNFPPVYYGGATPQPVSVGTIPGRDPTSSVSTTRAVPMPGTYSINKPDPDHKMGFPSHHFATGMSVSMSDC